MKLSPAIENYVALKRRATFAVHRLVAWYREGVNLQTRLPLLATYLGHVNVSGTQPYLPMTHELLAEAGTSRMNREVHARICGRLGAKFPGPTRQTDAWWG